MALSYLIRSGLVVGLFSLASLFPVRADNAWRADLPYRQRIQIDARGLDRDLVDFPLRMRLTDVRFARTLAAPDGRDLRALGADGPLPLQRISWTPGEIHFVVRVPNVRAGTIDLGFDLYFGRPETSAPSLSKVWNDAHVAVLSLAGNVENRAASRMASIRRSGYVVQNGWTPGLVMEQSHPWITLDRRHKGYLEIEPIASVPALVFAGRFRAASPEGRLTLLSGAGFDLVVDGAQLVFHENGRALAVGGVTRDRWHSVVLAIDPSDGERALTLDGIASARDRFPAPTSIPPVLRVGRGLVGAAETQFGGDLEDLRFLAGTPSPAWLAALGLNLSEANPLVLVGPLEQAEGGAVPPPPPELVGPVDGAESYKPAGATLQWQPALGAERYEVQWFADALGERLLGRIPAGAKLELALTAAQAGATEVHWTVVAKSSTGSTRAKDLFRLTFPRPTAPAAMQAAAEICPPEMDRPDGLEIALDGYLAGRIDRLGNYLLDFTRRNPGLLRMLRERPEKGVPAWAGVFAGQYLSSLQLVWRLTHRPELKAQTDAYVRDLIATQRADGYLAPFDGIDDSLGLWNHYAVMIGLLDYEQDTGDVAALAATRKIGDLVLQVYGPAGRLLPKSGGANEAVCHAMARLCRATGNVRYRDFVRYVIHEVWNEPGGVAYHRLGQENAPLSAFPVRRWEGVHNLLALSEMHWLTGDGDYRLDFERLWGTLLRTERHNTGGFSTNEGLLGAAYNRGTIETCCTVAWTLLCTDMFRLTGDSQAADELEWSTLNSALGSIPYDGTCSTYCTQPDGLRQFNVLRQGPPDGMELNCCSTNAARALGNIASWALLRTKDGLALNFYGPSRLSARLPSGNRFGLEQSTDYPRDGAIRLKVTVDEPEVLALRLRIPAWSARTRLTLNGLTLPVPAAGGYACLERTWSTGDEIGLELDFSPRVEIGRDDYAGRFCVFRGPLLLASDTRYSDGHAPTASPLEPKGLVLEPLPLPDGPGPWVLAHLTDRDGRRLTVCDFSSAGIFGTSYRSWLDLPPSRAKAKSTSPTSPPSL